MLQWVKRFLFATHFSGLPSERDAQNNWIKNTEREWQFTWHDLFDTDENLIALGEFDRPHPIPEDLDRDYRLIFGFAHATPETRKACFALFPSGSDMHQRFQYFLSSKPSAISEAEARGRFQKIAALIEKFGPNDDADLSKIRIVDRETEEGLDELRSASNITILLEKHSCSPHSDKNLKRIAARIFLTEPLYAAADNFYHLLDWVAAAMTGGVADKIYAELYELWEGGWQVALDQDGVILASRKL